MLPSRFLKMFKRSLKRHQTGQAIIILALGFIVLLGFVGIVTDVSLLYIRYAALRRAVDSAAVAAAGQLRTDRAATAPKLAAIQFLEFHGINTSNVFVETCEDMPSFWADSNSPNHVDGDGNPLDADDPKREERKELYDEVCDNQRKLVRVTAFIDSPNCVYGDITICRVRYHHPLCLVCVRDSNTRRCDCAGCVRIHAL